MKVPLSGPEITQVDKDAVLAVLDTGWLSIGPQIEAFEAQFKNYFGVKHAIGLNSGTSGLHLIVKALGLKAGDEVITTPFSFVASTNCLLMEGVVPVFVDIDPKTLNMDLSQVEAKITERTKGILPVDVFGQPMDMEAVQQLAKKHGLFVIEDSCEAIGASYKGIKSGTLCDAAVFAFYPNKQITTGEGGMIVTNDDQLADLCRSYRSQGRAVTGFWLHHERLGYNFRMSELQAALGVSQMKRLDDILDRRHEVAQRYNALLMDIPGLTLPFVHEEVTRMSWFVFVVQVAPEFDRDVVMEKLTERGIGCRPYFTPIHVQPYIQEQFGFTESDFPITADIGRRSIALPFFTNLEEEQQRYVAETLQDVLQQMKTV